MICLALYKGPASGFFNKLVHYVICIATWSKYSHCELSINGLCYSSSFRDGGVRKKSIDLTDGKWDVVSIEGADEARALARFAEREGRKYDWIGAFLSCTPWPRSESGKDFCGGINAYMLGLDKPQSWTPAELAQKFMEKR
mgnify:CR=1 FL=1